MALQDLLSVKPKKQKEVVIEKENLLKHLKEYQHIIAYWRMYPDRLVDYYCSLNPDNSFKFYWYQRLMLRAQMRHKQVFMVFCRAYSKSFIGVMALMLKGILYPGIQMFTVSEGKAQSADIISSKMKEICKLIPAMHKEILWDTRGKMETTRQTKDSVVYSFRNGSVIENIACSEKTRGRRFQSGLMEEAATLPQKELQSVIVPTLNVPRSVNGIVDENEMINQSQVYVTSAGYKGTFAYDKFIETLAMCVSQPERAFIIGGDFRVPIKFGAFSKDFMKDLRAEGTFNEATFEREYMSHWSGDVESAFFNSDTFDKHREIKLPEFSSNGRNNKNTYYVLGVDVGKFDCTTEVCVIKVSPAPTGLPRKQLVNIYNFDKEHFGMQAIEIKRIFNKYNCKCAVIDGNGLGIGLVDFLITDQVDPDTDEMLWNWGVDYKDDTEKQRYKQFVNENTIHNAMYIMKATTPLNSEMYSYCQNQMRNGKLKFLVDENVAKTERMNMTKWKNMKPEKRELELKPYILTSILKEEMMNLIRENPENPTVILKPSNTRIKHDKVSAYIYGLYYCKLQEEKKEKKRDLSSLMLYTKSSK